MAGSRCRAGPGGVRAALARETVRGVTLLALAAAAGCGGDATSVAPEPAPASGVVGTAPAVQRVAGTKTRFDARLDQEVSGDAEWIAAADLDGDARIDLAVATDVGNTVDLLFGRGDGTFEGPTSLPAGMRVRAVAPADLDGDGKLDLALTSKGDGHLRVFGNSMIFRPAMFDEAIELMVSSQAQTVHSVVEPGELHPANAMLLDETGLLSPSGMCPVHPDSKSWPVYYFTDGGVSASIGPVDDRTASLGYPAGIQPWRAIINGPLDVVHVHTMDDLRLARALYAYKNGSGYDALAAIDTTEGVP